jgi:hypothetical protein
MKPPDSHPAKKPSIGPGLVFALSVIGAGDYLGVPLRLD